MKAPKTNPEAGLTLIEIVLAVSILAIMGAMTYGSIARGFDAYETVTEIDARYHNVRVGLERMTREISMAFLTAPTRNAGREEMWKTLFRGEPGTPFAKLDFTSLAHDVLYADAKESDQCEIGYFGASDPDDPKKINLMRREDPRIDREPDEGGRAYVLAENVKDLKFRFYDPRTLEWTDEWDTEDVDYAGRLPTIVEIKLVVEDEDGQELPFVTKTRINLPNALPKY
ncbi:MAG: prepilin-type N-terminal cleavage/methylation domain-containing protein [Deltaproteobacteria bacterium]|nr:prepilin-type N-terminal cleavage/methylation domain-containing protein [Deltaproteobacteria bacterium]